MSPSFSFFAVRPLVDLRRVNPLNAERAFLHHAAHPDRHFRVEHHLFDRRDRVHLLLVGKIRYGLGYLSCRGSWLCQSR